MAELLVPQEWISEKILINSFIGGIGTLSPVSFQPISFTLFFSFTKHFRLRFGRRRTCCLLFHQNCGKCAERQESKKKQHIITITTRVKLLKPEHWSRTYHFYPTKNGVYDIRCTRKVLGCSIWMSKLQY